MCHSRVLLSRKWDPHVLTCLNLKRNGSLHFLVLNQSVTRFFWRTYEDPVDRCASGGARVGGGGATSAPRRFMDRWSETSPTKRVRRFLARGSQSLSPRRTCRATSSTDESGGYTVPNLLPGTYQVAVTLQGFKSYTARGIAVRPDLVLRVDARMGIGTLEESIVVSGTSVVLQTESAAVQSLTTADQLVTIPTSGRAWQTTIALMPGVRSPITLSPAAATTRRARWPSASTASRRTTRSFG